MRNLKSWKKFVVLSILLVVLSGLNIIPRVVYGTEPFNLNTHVFCGCQSKNDLQFTSFALDGLPTYCEHCGSDLREMTGYISTNKRYCELCDEYTWDNTYHSKCGQIVIDSEYISTQELGFDNVKQFYILHTILNISLLPLLYVVIFWIGFAFVLKVEYNYYRIKVDEKAPEPILK